MKPLLLAGHPALEFLDTTWSVQGDTIELLGDGRALVDWLVEVELLAADTGSQVRRRLPAADLDAAATDARRLRTWVSAWIERWSRAPNGPYESEVRKLNAILAQANEYLELERHNGRLGLVERSRGENPSELVAILGAQVAKLVASEDASLVKQCAGEHCTLWFVDRTKAHRRRFCSASACGNREKVAAFRERERQRAKRHRVKAV